MTAAPLSTKVPPAGVSTEPVHMPTPTPSPTPPFGKAPTGEAATYNLKPWKADDAWALIRVDPPVFPQNAAGQGYNSQGDWNLVRLTLLREIKARELGSSGLSTATADLIAPDTYYQLSIPVKSTLEPFRSALEAALNMDSDVEITPEGLSEFISGKLELNELNITGPYPAKNVLGDGQPGWIFGVNLDNSYVAAFALSGSFGKYHLVSPLKDWRTLYWSSQAVSTYDLNANGIPEVAIHDSYWGTGMTHYCGEVLHVYEWRDGLFVDLTPHLSTDAGTDTGGCLDFRFEKGADGLQSITTGNWIVSNCSIGDAWNVGSIDVQRRYEWNGSFFALAHAELSPMEPVLPKGDPLSYCRLSWVNEAGAANDQAFQALPKLLTDTDPERVAGYISTFGPAYLDFFRFKLGTWYAMRGQQSRALALLNQVRDRPANGVYQTASKLAAAFLQAYPAGSAYSGCVLANKVISIYDYPGGDYLDVRAMGKAWGFFDWQWQYGGGYTVLFNGTGTREDTANLCSLNNAFSLAVRDQSFGSSANVIRWLDNQGIPHTGLVEGDVDGDGRQDWILALGTGRNRRLDVWALLNKNGSVQPLFVKDLDQLPTNLPAAWNMFSPNPYAPRLNVYQWPEGLLVFRVVSNATWLGIDTLIDETPWEQSFQNFAIRPAQAGVNQPVPGAQELYIEKSGPGLSWKDDWEVYAWDDSLNTLVRASYPEYEQEQQVLRVEELLFNQGNPQAAIGILDGLLSNDHELLDSDVDAYHSLPTVRPYLLYLLGLAHEMKGDRQEALTSYWTIWHDYPLHPFSYVVEQRLINK